MNDVCITETGLEQLTGIATFVLVADRDLNILWASAPVLQRVADAPGLNVADIIQSLEPEGELSPTSIARRISMRHRVLLNDGDASIPLKGHWLSLRDGFMLLANPDVASAADLDRFSFNDFTDSDLTVELLTSREEHSMSLREARAAAVALAERHETIKAGSKRLKVANARLSQEIRERRKAEQRIERSKHFLQSVIDGLSDSLMVIDADHNVLLANTKALARVSGQDPVTDGLLCHQVSHGRNTPCTGDSHPCPLSQTLSTKAPVTVKHLHAGESGKQVIVEITAVPIMNAAGEITRVIESSRDVTDREWLQAQLAQAQKLESVGQLAAGIAHEINTPTQYIGDNIRFLQESFEDLQPICGRLGDLISAARGESAESKLADEVEKLIEHAELDYLRDEIPRAIGQAIEGVERVSEIVRAMKEFSHPGGKEKQQVDINHAIESTITVPRNEWKYVAELETDFDPDLPTVPCLPGDFNQVVLNIIVNAAHAIGTVVGDGSGGKGRITVSTRRVEGWAEIRISDSGCGIPEEIRDKIFDPFFTTKEVGKGTGQGLGIAHTVVTKKHGGTISVESEVGVGTTFVIRLPLDDPDAKAEQAEAVETVPE